MKINGLIVGDEEKKAINKAINKEEGKYFEEEYIKCQDNEA